MRAVTVFCKHRRVMLLEHRNELACTIVAPERGGEALKRIRTSLRSSLADETLEHLIRISEEGQHLVLL